MPLRPQPWALSLLKQEANLLIIAGPEKAIKYIDIIT
jgi:hypothetical protein